MRCEEDGHFNAAVLDFDGNSIEVVFKNGPDTREDGTIVEYSRVITWQRTTTMGGYRDDRSYVTSRTTTSSRHTSIPVATETMVQASSVASQPPNILRSHSEPVAVPQAAQASNNSNGGVATTILGTLLGAAAGAAVAYAMVNSERDSAKKEAEFNAFMDAKNAVKAASNFAQTANNFAQTANSFAQTATQTMLPAAPAPDPQPTYAPSTIHRNTDAYPNLSSSPPRAPTVYAQRQIDVESYHSTEVPLADTIHGQRQIEAPPPPPSYHSPSYVSAPPTEVAKCQPEYVPAASVAPSKARSHFGSHRSMTSPEFVTAEKATGTESSADNDKAKSTMSTAEKATSTVSSSDKETGTKSSAEKATSTVSSSASTAKAPSVVSVSKAQSVAYSTAPSTLISSFVADHEPKSDSKRSGEGSVHSHHSSRSKTRSSHSHSSKHSSHSKHNSSRSHGVDAAPYIPPPPPLPAQKVPPKVPSKTASLVNRVFGRESKPKEEDFIDDLNIEELTEDDFDTETVAPSDSISQIGSSHRRRHRSRRHDDDAASTISKQSSSSKHSKRSHRSHRSHKSRSQQSDDEGEEKQHRSSRPSGASEASEASTVRPGKGSRKDSVTDDRRYDNLFDKVQYGNGDVPIRGITPSMVSAANKNKTRTMIMHSLGQKMNLFEEGRK